VRKPARNTDWASHACEELEIVLKTEVGKTPEFYLLRLIAEVLDMSAQGENIYLTIGLNRPKNSHVITVTWDGDKMYAAGVGLETLSQACKSLLAQS